MKAKIFICFVFFTILNLSFEIQNSFSQKPELVVQMGHSGNVNSVAFSPDGKYALSGSLDKTLKLWDVNTGKEIRTFQGHSDIVFSVAFSPDGKYALSGSGDGTLKLWEIETGKELASLISMDENDWVVVTPDGYFDGSPNGMKNLHWVKGLEIYPLDAFYEDFYVDGLLKKIINGEKYQKD